MPDTSEMTDESANASRRRPVWRQVADDCTVRSRTGRFTAEFPGELELAERYGVSRGTIRSALRPLRESGMVPFERC